MTVPYPPICVSCAHFNGRLPNGLLTCDAFETIPAAICFNEVDHRQPVEGDGGVVFDQGSKPQPELDVVAYDAIFAAATNQSRMPE